MFQHLLLPLVILGNFRRRDELEGTWVLATEEMESRTPGLCVGSQVSGEEREGDIRKMGE